MSAAHRSLARLPTDLYRDLILGRADSDDPLELRRKICGKLKKFPKQTNSNNNEIVHESVTTVGQLLTRTSKLTLLRVLDPLLTYGTLGCITVILCFDDIE